MKYSEIVNNFFGYKIVTSNNDKLREFNRFGLDITADKGEDLHEVNGTPLEVIIYKAIDAGPRRIVEDTSFEVEGLNVGVNIRWLVDKLIEDKSLIGSKAIWTVYLGVNTGKEIKVFSGKIEGIITEPRGVGFGFDPIFQPYGSEYTLAELDTIGKKDDFSARKNAVNNMLSNSYEQVVQLTDIQPWYGDYQ